MLKKMMLMATMVAAVAAFVAPTASAAFEASNWGDKGSELKSTGTITGTGVLKFNATSGLGGVQCHVHVHITLNASSSTGTVTRFEVSSCEAFGFLKTVCNNPTAVTPTPTGGVNWVVHAQKEGTARRVLITGATIDNKFGNKTASCPAEEINVEGPNATSPLVATLDNNTAANSLVLGGEVNTGVGAAKAEGTLTATEGGGTYGIL